MHLRTVLYLWTGLAAGAQGASIVKSQDLKLPLEFEANRGQFAPEVLFLARTPSHFVYLTRAGMTLGWSSSTQRGAAMQMKLVHANASIRVAPENRLAGISNYFIGNDPSGWRRDVAHYGRIRYRAVWPGIDLVFHGSDQALEYDFAISPGADPSTIRLAFANDGGLSIDADGDGGANLYALNAQTGELIWKVRPVDHYAAMVTATPRYYKGVVYQPFASFEEALGGDPKFQCCTFRGSVAALDAGTGKQIWQTFTIAEAAKPTRKTPAGTQQSGPSGAAVWASPTIDEQLGVLYVATGDNYSDPPTNSSDAILAMDLKTGDILWSKQLTENDAYNNGCATPQRTNCPEAGGPDFDFGQPPILVGLGQGKRALVIAQKSGMVHAIDPDQKGKILWQTRGGEGGALGGSQWGSASDGRNVYVAISDIGMSGVADPKSPQGFRLILDPKKGGGLHALDLKTGKIVWSAKPAPCAAARTDCSPAQSAAVTAIPGVVFSGSVDGHLRAYSAAKGEVLWDADTAREFDAVNGKGARGGSMDAAGPAVVNGMVFVNSGYGQWGGMPGNVLLAFSVNGK